MPARPPPKQNSGYAALSGSIAVPPFGEHILHSRDTSRIVFVKRGHSISRDLWSHAQLREENTWPGKLCFPRRPVNGPGSARPSRIDAVLHHSGIRGRQGLPNRQERSWTQTIAFHRGFAKVDCFIPKPTRTKSGILRESKRLLGKSSCDRMAGNIIIREKTLNKYLEGRVVAYVS